MPANKEPRTHFRGIKLGNSRYHSIYGLCLCDDQGQFIRGKDGEPVPDPERNHQMRKTAATVSGGGATA